MERRFESVWQSGAGDRREDRTENPCNGWPPFEVARRVEADPDADQSPNPKMRLSVWHTISLVGRNVSLLISKRNSCHAMFPHHRDDLP
jgi:hypothetical protein